tara:strand:- start:51 stop:239 length:189 start_codon:yes stop_codon:yes gene_type:complete
MKNDETTKPVDGEVIIYFTNGTQRVFSDAKNIVNGGDTITFEHEGKKVLFKKPALAGWALPK